MIGNLVPLASKSFYHGSSTRQSLGLSYGKAGRDALTGSRITQAARSVGADQQSSRFKKIVQHTGRYG